MNKILIVKASSIGDVIHAFPVLPYLKGRFPEVEISWVVEKGIAPLLRSHPLIDRVIEINTRLWRNELFTIRTWKEFFHIRKALRESSYDAIFDLQGNVKSALFTLMAKGKAKVGFSYASVHEKINFFATNHHIDIDKRDPIRSQHLKIVSGYLGDVKEIIPGPILLKTAPEERLRLQSVLASSELAKGARIMVCFASRWGNKQLSFSTLFSFLQEIKNKFDPSYLFVYGSQEEQMQAERLCKAFSEQSIPIGNMSLPFWQNLMNEVDCVISVDSAALHLCATTGTPSFSVFGPSASSVFAPQRKLDAAVQGKCPYGMTFLKTCEKLRTCKTGACMKEISVEELTCSFMAFWEKAQHQKSSAMSV